MILVFTLATMSPEITEVRYICPEGYTMMEVRDDETGEYKLVCNSYVDQIPPTKVWIE